MQIVTLREDYFCSNTYLVINNNTAIVIDAGVSVETMNRAIDKYGIKKIGAILLTHAHYDHILGLEDYMKEFDCPIYIHNNGIDNLKNPINNYSQFTEKLIVIESNKIHPLCDDGMVEIGCFNVEYHYTPGHTDDCMCYIIDEVMFTGDTVFDGLIGRTDLANSNAEHMYNSLKKLALLSPCQMYFPGHGRKSDGVDMQRYLSELVDSDRLV